MSSNRRRKQGSTNMKHGYAHRAVFGRPAAVPRHQQYCKRYYIVIDDGVGQCRALTRDQPLAGGLMYCKQSLPRGQSHCAGHTPPAAAAAAAGHEVRQRMSLRAGKWRHFSGARQLSARTHSA